MAPDTRQPSVTAWIALQALTLGIPIDAVRAMTLRQLKAARRARAN